MAKDKERAPQRRGAASLWNVSESNYGPKPQLHVRDIVDAAVKIADERGLDAVSMSNVAKGLGFSTMALYRHVADKNELIEMMFDVGAGEPPELTHEEGDWREGMFQIAYHYSANVQKRPWLLEVPLAGVTVSPGSTAWLEVGLNVLETTGLDVGTRMQVYITVLWVLYGVERHRMETRRAIESAEAVGASTEHIRNYSASLMELLPKGKFPAVEEALKSGVFEQEDDDDLQIGLDLIFDGVEVMIARQN